VAVRLRATSFSFVELWTQETWAHYLLFMPGLWASLRLVRLLHCDTTQPRWVLETKTSFSSKIPLKFLLRLFFEGQDEIIIQSHSGFITIKYSFWLGVSWAVRDWIRPQSTNHGQRILRPRLIQTVTILSFDCIFVSLILWSPWTYGGCGPFNGFHRSWKNE
jgi:hypothetical protein